MGAADEPVEVVDASGAVERVVTRAAMRAGNLRHRTVYVAVTTSAGALVVHRRADDKDVWPGRWDVAFGGVAGVGEPWVDAARRELAEEAGAVVGPAALVDRGGGSYADADVAVAGRVFTVVHDGPFTCPDGEVAELALVPPGGLAAWLDRHDVCPDSRALVVPRLGMSRATPGSPGG
ncbi:MAG TPA: NUDIX domain-containing protein [Acidimicrobiales bacterium]